MNRPPIRPRVPSGTWWPYTTNLTVELSDLIAGLDAWLDRPRPRHGPRVRGIAVNLASWTVVPNRVEVAGRRILVAWVGGTGPLTGTAGPARVELLVVPSGTPYATGRAAMTEAADGRDAVRGTRIIADLTGPALDPGPAGRRPGRGPDQT